MSVPFEMCVYLYVYATVVWRRLHAFCFMPINGVVFALQFTQRNRIYAKMQRQTLSALTLTKWLMHNAHFYTDHTNGCLFKCVQVFYMI